VETETTPYTYIVKCNPLYLACLAACGRSDNARHVVRSWAHGWGSRKGVQGLPNRSQSYALKRAREAVKAAGCCLRPALPSRKLALFAADGTRVSPT